MRRLFKRTLALLGVLLVVLTAWGGCAYERYVVEEPGDEFDREHILAIIAQESPVYYRDGVTPIGVFFDQEHRRYVPYAELPTDWVHAIVASEDGTFFSHPGVSGKHLVRAMWQNVKAGKVVAGGSTLTQQTAKNLFYRPDRSMRSKWTELVYALRLERHFTKEDILEFYANQFHVSANGRGLGIAARYFFDKEPGALTTKECAFIAGMVKAPATYNPFIGESEERRAKARTAAENRTAYVLRRMHEDGYLDDREYERVAAEPLEFRRGSFQYDRSVVLDEVQRALEEPAFIELFERLGIDNPSTAGIRIVTTLDPAAQRESTYALWHHLSEVGSALEGGGPSELLLPPRTSMPMAPGVPLQRHEILAARVGWRDSALTLDVGGRACAVDDATAERVTALVGAAGGKSGAASRGKAKAAELEGLLAKEVPAGGLVLVSVREVGAEGPVCDLERRPDLQGAAVVLDRGAIRALVGGNDNRNYDRAIAARRQLGSTWKPLVYEAALHLGWLPNDRLDNRRAVFPFRGVWYYPRPDHAPEPWLPMSVVGARSENLASVWLLAHLTDRLNPEQMRRLTELTGLGRRAGESDRAWYERLRDTEDIRSTPERYEEFAFTRAREDVYSGLAFAGHPEDGPALRSLAHGHGFAAEIARVERTAATPERAARLEALRANLLSLEELAGRCLAGDPATLHRDPATGAIACGAAPAGWMPLAGRDVADAWSVVETLPDGSPVAPPAAPMGGEAAGLPTATGGSTAFPGEAASAVRTTPVPRDEVALAWLATAPIDGRVHLSTLRDLRAAVDRRRAEIAGKDPWDPEVLALHPDLRTLVGIRYVTSLVRAFGVEAELPTGLTLPLGAGEISLLDATRLYQGMLAGDAYEFRGQGFTEGSTAGLRASFALPPTTGDLGLIAEIRDEAGNVLYRSEAAPVRVADPTSGELVGDILRNVVRVGTGRRASGAVVLGGQALPVAGKTGTVNDYRNAAFVGMVPRTAGGRATWSDAYTVGVYVGYDDNRSMRKGRLRVQGASGALPAWIGIAQGLAGAGLLGEGGVAELTPSEGLERVEVAPGPEGQEGPTALVPVGSRRLFAPFTEPPTAASSAPEPDLPVEPLGPEGGEEASEPGGGPAAAGEPSVWDGL